MRFYIILFFVFIISFILAKYVIKYFLSLSTNPGKISGINHSKDTSTKGLDFFAKGKPSQDNISNPYLPKEPWKKGLNSETPHESDKMRQTMETIKENRDFKVVEKMLEDLKKPGFNNLEIPHINRLTLNDITIGFNDLKKKPGFNNLEKNTVWDWCVAELSHIISIGNILYGNYAIWLVITSIILLLAMVGAIIITIKQKKITKK